MAYADFLNNGDLQDRRNERMKLKGKVALITGSSSGIGKAVAILFAEEGADLIICSNQSVEEGKEVLEEVKQKGSDAIYIQADLSKETDIKNMFDVIQKKYGKLDILINNAGRAFNIPFKEITEETITKDLNTNLMSAMLCAKYAVELMKEEGWIINTSSIRGTDYSGRNGIMGFCAAKAGMNSFTKTLAMELAPKIYVNTVAPGFVYTNYMDTVTDEMKQKWLKDIPINRFIEPKEIAEVYLMLATSRMFTGSIVKPDGGYSLLNR